MFLYILKFKNKSLIKIGIAKKNNRILAHMRTYKDYGIDLQSSYKVIAKHEEDIILLERQILTDYRDYFVTDKNLSGRDGYTEIRDSRILHSIIEDVACKMRKFPDKEIKINNGIKIMRSVGLKTKSSKKSNETLKCENDNEIQRYIRNVIKYKQNINSINVSDNEVYIKFTGLSKKQYKDITDNCWVNFETHDTFISFGGGHSNLRRTSFTTDIDLRHKNELGVVKRFKDNLSTAINEMYR